MLNNEQEDGKSVDDNRTIPTASFSGGAIGPGRQVGRYKLLNILGEGGCGIVYLAEQRRPVKRRVALKVIKPGMDTKQVIARFEAERQALALLDYPNIAHVYDAGTTSNGRPYFVMEHVKGIPITEHCDREKLAIEERLDLFIKVCEAVQYAHQKGIIHRDIKPSNVQVAFQGGQAVPKIIDFGVAKAISQPLTERTLVTEQGQFVGTPEYMSPEQAEMTTQDIDTRTDIYSLGVVLYELLTGTLPFDSNTLRKGGVGHIRLMIREEEPKTPSTQLSTISGEESVRIAQLRRTDVRALGRKLHGDLDWITIKAMEKDRTRRYETAHGLARDIKRHLNNEPVTARPLSRLYRFQKLVRRNRGIFVGMAVVAVALLMALTVSAVSLVSERQARRAAVTAQKKEAELRRQFQAQAYTSDISVAQQARSMNDLGRTQRLLNSHRPAPGELDLRGWEWRYLWQECQSDAIGKLCQYPKSAYSVSYSPNGRMLAVAGTKVDQFVDIWDVMSHKRMDKLQLDKGNVVAFSPQGDLLAIASGRRINLYRVGTKDIVRPPLVLDRNAQDIKFSRDGRRLASLSYPDVATVWEVDNWMVVRRITGVPPLYTGLGALDFSPDGECLAIGDANHRLQVVDLASGKINFEIPEAHPESISTVAWSPEGSVIATGSGYSLGKILLWDGDSGKSLGALEGHTSWICELVFSADGQWLYSASGDQTIRIWDIGLRRCLTTLRGSNDEIYGLTLSPDGTTLASSGKDGVVAFWNAHPKLKQELPKLIALGKQAEPAFAPSSRVLAVPREGTVSLIDLTTLEEIKRLSAPDSDVKYVLFSPDGTLLVSGDNNGRIHVWSYPEGHILQVLDYPDVRISPWRFRADGRRLLSKGNLGKMIWWDTLTWQAIQTFNTGGFRYGDISPDGRLMAISGREGSIRWLNAETGELLATTTDAHRHPVDGIAFSKDSSRPLVASVAQDGTLAIWDPSTFQLIDSFKGHILGAHAVAFSPDGCRVATGSNRHQAVRLWDVSTHRELITLEGQGSLFKSVAFSPDGRWIAACNMEGELHLWRAPTWEEIKAEEKKLQIARSP